MVVSLVGAAWSLWERTQHDPWLRLLGKARKQLAKGGITSTAASTPRELALQLPAKFGTSTSAIHDWLLQLEAQRYRPANASGQPALNQLRKQFKQLRWPA